MLNVIRQTGTPYQKTCFFGNAATKAAKDWNVFKGDQIPSSMELNPLFYQYTKPTDKVLDIGMGFGKTMFDIAEKGYTNLSGIDPNVSGIEFANKEAKRRGLNADFRVGNALKLPFKDNEFDTAVTQAFLTVIVDKNDRKQIISEIARVLKPGGTYYLADMAVTDETYKKRYDQGAAKGYPYGTIDAHNKETGAIEYQARHYTFEELNELLEDAGLKVVDKNLEMGKSRSGHNLKQHFIIAKKQ